MFPDSTAKRHAVRELLEERDRLIDISDLDGDVVDADEPGHVALKRGYRAFDSAQTDASSTTVAAAAAMSCTLAHSLTEW